MSIIFQLFSAEDLQKLDHADLLELRKVIIKALAEDPDHPPENLPPLRLNLTPKTQPGAEQPPQIHEVLSRRFHEVAQQLRRSSTTPSQQPFDFNKLTEQSSDPKNQEKEKLILEWAISCELNHIEFYDKLLTAQKVAYEFFEKTIKSKMAERKEPVPPNIRIKEPDSSYSPFNPRHPGNKLYNP